MPPRFCAAAVRSNLSKCVIYILRSDSWPPVGTTHRTRSALSLTTTSIGSPGANLRAFDMRFVSTWSSRSASQRSLGPPRRFGALSGSQYDWHPREIGQPRRGRHRLGPSGQGSAAGRPEASRETSSSSFTRRVRRSICFMLFWTRSGALSFSAAPEVARFRSRTKRSS